MGIVMVTYNGHIVGFCTARHAHLVEHFDSVDGEQVAPFLLAMCFYAIEVQRSPRLPPYTEGAARRFARTMLIPQEVLEHPNDFEAEAVASWLGVPVNELHAAMHARRRDARCVMRSSASRAPAARRGWHRR